MQDVPLPALFQRGRALLKQLEGLPASDAGTQQLVQRGGAVWRQAAAAADALALFSSNEELEDLATADIKYLLIPFYAAEALTHTHAGWCAGTLRLAHRCSGWPSWHGPSAVAWSRAHSVHRASCRRRSCAVQPTPALASPR